MKEKLQVALGTFGSIIYWILTLFITILPVVMIGTPFWLSFIIFLICSFLPYLSLPLWIWGLVEAIKGPQDIFAIIYYVATVLIFLPTIISIFSGLVIGAIDESKELQKHNEDKVLKDENLATETDSKVDNKMPTAEIQEEQELISSETEVISANAQNVDNAIMVTNQNIKPSSNHLSLPIIIIISLLLIITALLLIIITNSFTSQQSQEPSSLTTMTTESITFNTQSDRTISTSSKPYNEKYMSKIRRKDTKNYIINSYEELMDRDILLKKSYGKVESDDDSVVEITVSQQKKLYNKLINDKDLIIDILGQEKYNKILNNTKKVEKSNYFIDYVNSH